MKNVKIDDLCKLKILVIGASGGTGQLIVSQALRSGHEVTALVRSTEKGRALSGAKLIIGNARDEATLHKAVKGQQVVINALGTPVSPLREVTLLSRVTQALINAMQAENVPRLICITGIGAGDSNGHGGFLFDYLLLPLLLRKVYADKNRQEKIVRNSGLEWILVRPSVLNNKPGRGSILSLTDFSDFHGGTISREDVAKFCLDQVHADKWLYHSPLITW